MSVRSCRATIHDAEGIEHTAEVTAESLYEAAALGLRQFRKSDWSREASLETAILKVEVCEPSTFYRVKVVDLEQWVTRSGGKPRDVALRQKVRSGMSG
jgi:hypothetical protein